MSGPIFSKKVILHLKEGTDLNEVARIIGSEYGCVLSGSSYSCMEKDNGNPVAHALACDKVTEDCFKKYECVTSVEVKPHT